MAAEFRILQHIRNMYGATLDDRSPENGSAIRLCGVALEVLALLRRQAVGCGKRIGITLATSNQGDVRLAQASRRFDEGVQHSLQVERRAADDLENVGGGRLLLERLAQLLRARLLGFEQAGILDS